MNREKAREFLEKELRKRPTVKASAIFTGKHGSMGFHAGRFYAVTFVKRRGEVVPQRHAEQLAHPPRDL